MKKVIPALIILSTLMSCKKDVKVAENQENTTDSLQLEKTEVIENTPVKAMPEFTVAQVSDLVKAKENDTLYVTNFFATWCGPCRNEIPHFKEKMESMKGQPVKFTFVSLDNKTEWETEVKNFGAEYGIGNNIVLLDGSQIGPDFFSKNFKTWDGGSIPFTIFSKKGKSEEFLGMMTKEQLEEKLSSLN